MGLHEIKKGLDLPITGTPEQTIDTARTPDQVALIASDYIGMKPTFFVKEGDAVKRGQLLFEDKKTPGVKYTAPAAGVIKAINRGARRAFQSVVITLAEEERSGALSESTQVSFAHYQGDNVNSVSREQTRDLLVESGLWTALRTRPFSKIPAPESLPHAIFINAMDSNPLAANMDVVMEGRSADIDAGLQVLSKLTDGTLFFCKARGSAITPGTFDRLQVEEFSGPHPAGNVGTHIHLLSPVYREKTVWHIGIQDVAAIGVLFQTGMLDPTRIVALGGPGATKPRLLRTRLGVYLDALLEDELDTSEQRVISGSVFAGRAASGEVHGYLGRYSQIISILPENRERVFLGWLSPGLEKFSVTQAFLSSLIPEKLFKFTTSTNGSHRAIMPIGVYEDVMPLDIMATYLLRAIAVGDAERAEQLGLLELDEEDIALCSFVCPGKNDFVTMLRNNLEIIEKEG